MEFRKDEPLYLQIADRIKAAIVKGDYPGGTRIPPVRELALAWRINPNTVAKAYRLLQSENWIGSRIGDGNYATPLADDVRHRARRELLETKFAELLADAAGLGMPAEELEAAFRQFLERNPSR